MPSDDDGRFDTGRWTMDLATVISLAVGIVALCISVYGVFERRAAGTHQMRTQLVGVLDQLQDIDAREIDLHAQERTPSSERALGELNEHRALLAEQAAALDAKLHGQGVAANEYACLASAFEGIGDLDVAVVYWRRATSTADRDAVDRSAHTSDAALVPSFARAACWRGLAGCLTGLGRVDEACAARRTSLEALPTTHDRGLHDRVLTLLDWRWEQLARPSSDGPTADELVSDARTSAGTIGDPWLRHYTEDLIDEAVAEPAHRPGVRRRHGHGAGGGRTHGHRVGAPTA